MFCTDVHIYKQIYKRKKRNSLKMVKVTLNIQLTLHYFM